MGPFDQPPVPHFRVSPLGVVPKKTEGKFRLIHRLSFLEGYSVNDAMPSELCSVHYTSFDTAVHMVKVCGFGAEMVKADIKSAFCLLSVHSSNCDLLRFFFEGTYYIDRALPMGCSISCAAFEHFSSFLEWNLRLRVGMISAAHYLDYFCMWEKRVRRVFIALEGLSGHGQGFRTAIGRGKDRRVIIHSDFPENRIGHRSTSMLPPID